MINNPPEYDMMARVERDHWWYRSLHTRTHQAIAQYFGHRDVAILDAGCGTGGLLSFLRDQGYGELLGFDLSPLAVSYCNEQNLAVGEADLNDIEHTFPGRHFDCIVSNDTLYHVSSERRHLFLKNAAKRLSPQGILILNLPALSCLRGLHDEAVGITHRFDRHDVTALAEAADLVIKETHFWPTLLTPAIWLVRVCQRYFRRRPEANQLPKSDLKLHASWLNNFLFWLIQLEVRYLPPVPFGSSLFVILSRKS